jgi:hypothetical protein
LAERVRNAFAESPRYHGDQNVDAPVFPASQVIAVVDLPKEEVWRAMASALNEFMHSNEFARR